MNQQIDYVGEVRRMTDEFTRVTRDSELTGEVAACPGWTAHDLVSHLGVVHRWAAGIVRAGEPGDLVETEAPIASDDAANWYAEGAAELVAALEVADPDEPCWNFTGIHQHKGFWRRRQVHEVHVHLLDLTRAVGASMDPVAVAVSADGVGEVLDTFMPRLARREIFPELDAPLGVVATDADLAWVISPRRPLDDGDGADPRLPVLDGPSAASGVLPADQLRGEAKPLLEVLWKRTPFDVLELYGDRDRVLRYVGSQLTS
jgi:uncharacterized protein (TIGR03083 family)